jgi:hypothetical protein
MITTDVFYLNGEASTAWDVADFINAATERGDVAVNGVIAKSRWGGNPATGWGTGSLSVTTPARTTRGNNEVWFKVGATVTVTVSS